MPLAPAQTRQLGRSEVELTQLGFGGAPLGELFTRISDGTAQATLQAAWEAGIRYFDTAPSYGRGLSEHRIGDFLRGRSAAEYLLSTKVGRVFRRPRDLAHFDPGIAAGGLPFDFEWDYTYDGIMRSYDDSLQRLGLPRVDLLIIHDLDLWNHGSAERVAAHLGQLVTSGYGALDMLRRSGEIRAIGAGINQVGMIPRLLDSFDIDFFLVAMPYTLLEHEAIANELARCEDQGVGVVVGAVFNSGILATGPIQGAKYNYGDAPDAVLERVRRIESVCRRHGVALAAAALQFPMGHSSVASVIPGGFDPEHVRQNVRHFQAHIPEALWDELKSEGLIDADAAVPAVSASSPSAASLRSQGVGRGARARALG